MSKKFKKISFILIDVIVLAFFGWYLTYNLVAKNANSEEMAQGDFKLQSLFANNTVTKCRTSVNGRSMSSIGQYRAVSTTGYASSISASGACSYSGGGVTCNSAGTCTITSRGSGGSCTSASLCCVSAWSGGTQYCNMDSTMSTYSELWADQNSACYKWYGAVNDPNHPGKYCVTKSTRSGPCCSGGGGGGGPTSGTTSYTLTVHHYKDGTTENPPGCSDPAVQTKEQGSSYTTSACSPTGGWSLKSNPTNANGSMDDNVTVIYYYVPSYTVTVHHYVTGTSNKVYDDEIASYPQGATYSTSSHPTNTLYNNYKNVYVWNGSVPSGSSGTVTGNITVTYYYSNSCPTSSSTPGTLFEGVGRYTFISAGNNNANRGTSRAAADYSFITCEQNFTSASGGTGSNGKVTATNDLNCAKLRSAAASVGVNNITNMSGSYLNLTGEIKYAMFEFGFYKNVTGSNMTAQTVLIRPNGTARVITTNHNADPSTQTEISVGGMIDITEDVRQGGPGWYWVAFVDAKLRPQMHWVITGIQESSSSPISYIKYINAYLSLRNGDEGAVYFNSQYNLSGQYQIFGTARGAGLGAWPEAGYTEDKAWAILSDGSQQQLFERVYNGKTYFAGRTNTDFLNGTYSTTRSHNIRGGELDIYNEAMSSAYFAGKEPMGYRFKKVGSNGLLVTTVGLRKELKTPEMSITTQITPRTLFAPTTQMTIKTTVTNNVAGDGQCYISYDNIIKSSVHQDLGTPTNITLTYDGQTYTATYDSASRKVVGSNIIYMECGKPAILTYNATVQDSIANHVQDGKFKLNTTATNDYAITRCDPNKTTITATDAVETPALAKLTVNHYVIETNGMLNDTISVCPTYEHEAANAPFIGQSYTASICSSIPTGYYFDGNYTITRGSGTYNASTRQVTGTHSVLRQDGGTVVNFYYKRQAATVIIHHCKVGFNCSNSSTSGQLHADDIYTDYNYGDTYPMPKHALPSYYEPNELSDSRYEWDRQLPSNYQGRITVSPLEITYHYQEKKGSYIVHHYLKGTENSANPTLLCTDEVHNDLAYGYYYETDSCSSILNLYDEAVCTGASSVVPGNATGYINGPLTEVKYCYSHKLSNVTTHHYMMKNDGTKTTTPVHPNVNQNGLFYGDMYTTASVGSVELNNDGVGGYIFKNRYHYANVHDGDPVTSTINRSSYTVNYYYAPNPATVTVYHFKEGTNEEICPTIEDNAAYYDKTINYDKCTNLTDPKFQYKSVSTNVSDGSVTVSGSNVTGSVNQDTIIIIYEYEAIPTTYTVHHYIDGSNPPVRVFDDEVHDVRFGQSYETSSKASSLLYEEYRNKYQYSGRVVGTPQGVITSSNMEITYYYSPIPVRVVTHHVDKRDTTKNVHDNDVQNLYYGAHYETHSYNPEDLIAPDYKDIYAFTGVTYGDAVSGDITSVKINNQYDIYYEYDLSQAAYIVHHYVCGTTTQVSPDIRRTENFGGTYHTNKIESSGLVGIYKNNYQYSTVTTTDTHATVNLTTGDTSGTFDQDRIEITYCYVPKKARITTHYYVEGTTTRVHADDVQTNVDFGTDYSTPLLASSALDGEYKDNYIYSAIDPSYDPATGNVGKDEIEVVYYYVRNPIILTTRHYIKGTSIDVSSSTCPETTEELNRRDTYSKSKCTNLPNGYQYDNVKSTDANTTLNQGAGTASGTITESTTITFEYSLVGIGLTVQYFDIDTGERFTQYDKFLDKSYGDSIIERPITIPDYEYVSAEVDTGDSTSSEYSITPSTGVVNGTIRKNTTIKFYYRRVFDLIVHHYKNNTEPKVSVCEDEHNRLGYNTEYEKNPCANKLRLGNYRYVAVESNDSNTTLNDDTGKATGTIKNSVTITYYYDVPSNTPTTQKSGTTLVNTRDDVFDYTLTYVGNIENYVGHVKYKLVDKLPYPLKVGDSRIDLDGGLYDASSKTIVWEIEEDINTGRNGQEQKNIEKNIKVVYQDIPVTVSSITNIFDTSTELEGSVKTTTNELETEFRRFTLTVIHLMEGSNEEIDVCPPEIRENLNYGYLYSTLPCQTLGSNYLLKAIQTRDSSNNPIDAEASGILTSDVTLYYYYNYRNYNLVVNHLDVDTNEKLIPEKAEAKIYGSTYEEGTITKDHYQFDHLYVSDENANKTNDNVSGTITNDTEITFFYKKYVTINIKHIDEDTNEVLSEETREVPYRSDYEEHKKDIPKYEFVDVTSSDPESIINDDKVSGKFEDDVNIVYRYKKQLDLVVNHYKKGTTEPICATETEVLPYNTNYEKNKCDDSLLGEYIYAYVESTDSDSSINDPLGKVNGTIKDDTTINFYYELTEITQDVKKTGPELLHSRSAAFNYKITDKVTLKDYRGNATITITDKLEYPIDTARSNLNGGTYNENNATITWVVPWDDISTNGTTNNTAVKDISIEFTIYYTGVPETVEVITNRVSAYVETAKVFDREENYVDTTIEPFELVVHHYKEGTTQELCPTTTEFVDEGTSYTKEKCNLDEYDFIEVKKNGTVIPNNTGTVTENISQDTTLDFIYRKKDSKLNTTLTKTGPDEITDIYQEVEYDIHYEGHIVDYRGNGEITITDTLPYRINTNKSNLDGGEYDGSYKIVWKVNWNDIDTYNGKNDTIEVNKKIKVVYLDINIDRKIMSNNVEAKTVLSDKTDLVTATKETDINLPGNIIVHHYVHGTTDRLFDDDEANGQIHEKYHSEPHEKEGYQIIDRPSKEDVEFTLEPQVLIYTYEKLKYDIDTEVIGGNGDITGDEEVPYGEDSTPDNIVITPDDGYEIERVIIDGREIELIERDKLVIDNFKNVKEDHLVQVEFSEAPIEVPITGSRAKLIIVGIILVLVNVLFITQSEFIKNIFKNKKRLES